MHPNAYQLEDRLCLVTGAAGGIGLAIATAFAREGARVAMLDRDAETLQAAAGNLRAAGHDVCAQACDVTDNEALEAARAALLRHRGAETDILVNCAGIQSPAPLAEITPAQWRRQMAVNLQSYLACAQIFSRGMLARRSGAIVHVGSIQGHFPRLGAGGYSSSKAALLMLSRQLAGEWGPLGIRSNVVSPGWVRTPMSAHIYADPTFAAARIARVPLRRIGTPEDSAEAVLFLASNRARYVNGAEILVDGGLACAAFDLPSATNGGFQQQS